MKTLRSSFGIFLFVILLAPYALLAQSPAQDPLSVIITGPDDIAVGRTLILDASSTTGLGENTTFTWYQDDSNQPISRSIEAVYTPETAGESTFRLVVTTEIDGEEVEAEMEHRVVFFNRKIVVIADDTVEEEKLAQHARVAEEANIYLRILQPHTQTVPLTMEETLSNLISEESDVFAGADTTIVWTEGIVGLQALMKAMEQKPDALPLLRNQSIILISSRSLKTLSRTAQGPFSVLDPERIILTRKEGINPLFATANVADFITQLDERDIDMLLIDAETTALRPWNFLSSLVNYMLTHGVSSQVIILLLSLPLIATIIAFLKQVIGMTAFGLFTPSIIALSFLSLGWEVGVFFLIFILITGYATRAFMRNWNVLYIPKVAIIITVVSITLMILLGISSAIDITYNRETVFILLIMSTLAEGFLNLKKEEGWASAVISVGETIVGAMLCVFIVQWPTLQSILLAYPELILSTFLVNIFLGRWTGLRLVEYFRFREVFRHLQEEE